MPYEKNELFFLKISAAIYLVGLFFMEKNPEIAAVLIIIAVGVLILPSMGSPEFSTCLGIGAFCGILGLHGSYTVYQELGETRRWNGYLIQHQCEERDYVEVGFTGGGCDSRTGICEPAEPTWELEYFCKSTKKTINFADFKKGYYGYK